MNTFTRSIFCRMILLCCLLGPIAGCYTDRAARDRAKVLAADIDDLRLEQSDRLDRINRQYRFDYAQLVAEMSRLRQDQLGQYFTLDTMEASDQILAEWERETLPKRLRDRFLDALGRRRERLLETDKAINAARTAYADAYQAVQLNLSQLKAAQAGVEALSQEEDRRKTVADFVQTLARIYNNLRDQEKDAQAKSN